MKKNSPEFIDQSVFSQEQSVSQAPPAEIARKEFVREHKKELEQKKRKTLFLFLGIVLVVSAVVALFLVEPRPQEEIVISPTPTYAPLDTSLLDKKLQRLEQAVQEADPFTKPLIPPPVDMDVEF